MKIFPKILQKPYVYYNIIYINHKEMTMNNTVLRLLQIFEEETDDEHMLTKAEILQILASEGFDSINEKQFYRKIQELIDNGYNIETKKGKSTYYFMRKSRLNKEEWIYLLTMILSNKDLSKKETKHMIDALENMSICYKSIEYAKKYKEKINCEKSKINQLSNFRVFLKAMDENKLFKCKQFKKIGNEYEFSDIKILQAIDYYMKDNQLILIVMEDKQRKEYYLNTMIDFEII